MATGKRYYWMKLKESFMTSDTIDYFMSQPDGANYVVLYQMLCLKTINTEGRLSRQIGEIIIPFDVEKIQRDCKWFSIDTIRVALNLYRQAGLIYEDVDGTLVLADHKNLVGSETDWASQKKNQRLSSGTEVRTLSTPMSPECPPACPENVHTDIRDRDKSTENRDKRPETRGKEKKADAFSELAGGDTELLEALKDFEKMRNSVKKPMTDRAKKMLVNKLQREFAPSVWIAVLDQSIKNCWLDVYPLKDNYTAPQRKNAVVDDLMAVHAMFEAEEDL